MVLTSVPLSMLVLCELGGLGDETPTTQTFPLDVSTSSMVVAVVGGGGGVAPVFGRESSQESSTLELPSGLSLERWPLADTPFSCLLLE